MSLCANGKRQSNTVYKIQGAVHLTTKRLPIKFDQSLINNVYHNSNVYRSSFNINESLIMLALRLLLIAIILLVASAVVVVAAAASVVVVIIHVCRIEIIH